MGYNFNRIKISGGIMIISTPTENVRDLDGIMSDSSKYSKKEMIRKIQNGYYK